MFRKSYAIIEIAVVEGIHDGHLTIRGGFFALMEGKQPMPERSNGCSECFTDSSMPPTMTRGKRHDCLFDTSDSQSPVSFQNHNLTKGPYAMLRMMTLVLKPLTLLLTCCIGAGVAWSADEYDYDLVHSSVSFKARHLDISWIHGRFNDVSGKFIIDRDDVTKSSFQLTIKAESVDTANPARDEHLRQPDYFDTKQFPTIEFKSTAVKAIEDGFEVTGDFTMHGTTKKIVVKLMGGKEIESRGVKRVGFSTELKLKRSDFNFDKSGIGAIGDEAIILIDCEGMRK